MSLRLRQAVPGRPSTLTSYNVTSLQLKEHSKSFILYPSSGNVVVLDTYLELADTLQFWSALPHRVSSSSQARVEGVVADPDSGLVLAWSGVHIVAWKYATVKGRTAWTIHSTLVVGSSITSLDYLDGLLVLALQTGVEAWRMDPEAVIIVWDRLWDLPYLNAGTVTVSPSLTHVAWSTPGFKSVMVLGLDRKSMAVGDPQEIRHPRPIQWIGWRKTAAKGSDPMLYTITMDQIFRIYGPVLDDPTCFQLLSSLDRRSFNVPVTGHADDKGKRKRSGLPQGTIWPLDGKVLRMAVEAELKEIQAGKGLVPDATLQLLDSISNDEGDLVMWIGEDGGVSLRSIINIDRKPPTLLKSLPIAKLRLPQLPCSADQWSQRASLLYDTSSAQLLAFLPPSSSSASITAVKIVFRNLLSSVPTSIVPSGPPPREEETTEVQLENDIARFVRTPNGRGLLAMTESSEVGVWYKDRVGKLDKDGSHNRSLVGKGHWTEKVKPKASAIFSKGRAIVFFTDDQPGGRITLQHLDYDVSKPTTPVPLPDFELDMGDNIAFLLAVSDIDDGYAALARRTQRAIVIAASNQGHSWVWRITSNLTISSDADLDTTPHIQLLSHYVLPVEGGQPHLILPVDPMGWHSSVVDWKTDTPLQDMIVTVSKDGVLEFWKPELGHHFEGESPRDERVHTHRKISEPAKPGFEVHDTAWKRSGIVRTGRVDALTARCSSRKKTVLIYQLPDERYEMTIWDSNVSEFSTGLELTRVFEPGEKVQDLDWTTTSDLQSVLAVGFPHSVYLVCEQRLSYTETTPGWGPFLSIDLTKYTNVPISDSIWLAGGSLAIGAGNQIYLFSRFLDRGQPVSSPAPSVRSMALDPEDAEDIFQLIAWQNGPLLDYHPTNLTQCLLWDKIDLVKSILIDLVKQLKTAEDAGRRRIAGTRFEPEMFYQSKESQSTANQRTAERRYDGLFDSAPTVPTEDDEGFSPALLQDLITRLQGPVSLPIGRSEKAQLAIVAQAALEVERDRRSLDKCGFRYLLSVRLAANQQQVSSIANTHKNGLVNGINNTSLPHISFRNFVWALHSESQEMLLNAATTSCADGKMLWPDAKRLGIFLWLKSSESIKSQLEIVARNRFMADEDRDPTSCSLIFFALGKKKVVHGLWRQAPGHKEQSLMLKFLANDFELDRWKTAAVKNAYALLSKQRYEYAAAFFMLGGCPKDAINVCVRQLNDWQLGFALARAVEGGTDGPLVRWVMEDTVVPLALAGGHRWLATWAFWILGRRDLAVRVLISPMEDVAQSWSEANVLPVGQPQNDDPSLLLLFQHLKSKSLQTAKGTSEIPEKTEFDFVLHNARVFFRMGCHSLGLALLHSWSFDRPFFPPARMRSKKPSAESTVPGTPLDGRPRRPSLSHSGSGSFVRPSPRRPSFMLSNHKRRESMVMDMDVLAEGSSEPTSRVPSPPVDVYLNGKVSESAIEEGDTVELPVVNPPKKAGNLMKELKQDVQQGAMEFNMDNFF